jgi:hypothetical protein
MGDSNENVIKDFSHVAVDTEGKVKVKKRVCLSKKITEASMHSRVQDEL